MSSVESFIEELAEINDNDFASAKDFPLMPEGEAFDMGKAEDGTPLIDPRSMVAGACGAERNDDE